MAKKTKEIPVEHINNQPITSVLTENYMPYTMSVIISRAIPEIDGFKPSHRKLLYTMYEMNLLNGPRTKSANIVGQTMKLNPHGDAAIYETMVRLTCGYEALLTPFIDSKGNFGKQFSRDMAYAASRYTEAKLESVCNELFGDIDKDTVDFVPNYDGKLQEPTLLPCTFPNILANPNLGIAVGMASSICSFNLKELCDTTIALIKNPGHNLIETLPAPDFPSGGLLLYDVPAMEEIYRTGKGSFRLRAKYTYDEKHNCIDIKEIPYTTTIEAIIDKIADFIKSGKIKEISDIRDETDLNGLKITIDLKRGADPSRLMQRLFQMTTLQDSFSCNFNVLIGGTPMILGVKELLNEWIAFRSECVRRKTFFNKNKKEEKLHLLLGLNKILLDIDKAISIIRKTDEDKEVVPNLMIGFGIDKIQAEYVAEIKLRNLNKSYILNAISNIDDLKREIADLADILSSRKRVEKIIISELNNVAKKYGQQRKTEIIYEDELKSPPNEEPPAEDYAVTLFMTKEGYFKKITPLSLRMSGEQKLKEGDFIVFTHEATNRQEILVFTNAHQVYKADLSDFDDHKASILGDFLPVKLNMDEGEYPVLLAVTSDYTGNMLFFFEGGRAVRIPLSAYKTKQKRKKLTSAYCNKFELISGWQLNKEEDFVMFSSSGRILIINSGEVPIKTTKTSQGIVVMAVRKNQKLIRTIPLNECDLTNPAAYRARSLPSSGMLPKAGDKDLDQLKL